jgi:hypothetical protein
MRCYGINATSVLIFVRTADEPTLPVLKTLRHNLARDLLASVAQTSVTRALKNATVKVSCTLQKLHYPKVHVLKKMFGLSLSDRSFVTISSVILPALPEWLRCSDGELQKGSQSPSSARKMSESQKTQVQKVVGPNPKWSDRTFEYAISSGFRVPARIGRVGIGGYPAGS